MAGCARSAGPRRVRAAKTGSWPGRDTGGPGLVGERADGVEPVNAKKLVMLAVVALLVFVLITQPTQSANAVSTVLGWLRDAAEAVITFVKNVFS
ncbi:hypothetical protein GCM10029964_100590 [Kibdelosporangium lantanae]